MAQISQDYIYILKLLHPKHFKTIFIYKSGGKFMSRKDDDEKAYTTYDDIIGRSIRRGTRKALKALTLGILFGNDPIREIGSDAAEELITKVIPRSMNKNDDD